MTSKEALEILNAYRDYHYNSDIKEKWAAVNALNVILPEYVKLAERDTPMKPAVFNYREHGIEHVECRNGCEPFRERYKFCPHCGQRLM